MPSKHAVGSSILPGIIKADLFGQSFFIMKNQIEYSNGIFYSANDFFKQKFGSKVYKVSINASCTCPNRDGSKGFGGCIFCGETGSGDFVSNGNLPIFQQIENGILLVKNKIRTEKYIAYFQNFTSTYGDEYLLYKKYIEAIKFPGVVGISIATRPDCISEKMFSYLKSVAEKTFLMIELGFQTSKAESVKYIRRMYENSVFDECVLKIKQLIPNAHVVSHLIFGLPYEDEKDMISSVKYVLNVKIDGIKISLLHVLKNTDLAKDYKCGKFECLEMNEYFKILGKALKIIPSNIVIHRLTGDGSKKNLIAPIWSANKKNVWNSMIKYFKENAIVQGK